MPLTDKWVEGFARVCHLAIVNGTRRPRTRSPEEVVAVLARAAVEGRFPHWVDGFGVLAAFDAREWLLADRLSRRHAISRRERLLWGSVNLDEPSGFVAVVASWQPDGHLREAAVDVLGTRCGPVVATALAVRLLDDLTHVREAALRALRPQLSARLSSEVAGPVLAVLAAAGERQYACEAIEAVLDVLRTGEDADTDTLPG